MELKLMETLEFLIAILGLIKAILPTIWAIHAFYFRNSEKYICLHMSIFYTSFNSTLFLLDADTLRRHTLIC